jgi:uncharacterized protein YkwD/uncharacterized membrane protein required for colicin V production
MPLFSNLNEFLKFLTFAPLGLNWIDFLIIFVIVFYAIEGYAVGLLRSILDFLSFILSFVFALAFYNFFAGALIGVFGWPQSFANAVGFFIGAFIAEIALSILFRQVILLDKFRTYKSKLDPRVFSLLGSFPGILSAIVLSTFVLTLVTALPVAPYMKSSIFNSRIGSNLVSNTFGLENRLSKVFGPAVHDAMAFLTVEPQSSDSVSLRFKTEEISIDETAEKEMLVMVNAERKKAGLSELAGDFPLTLVGRRHCEDMARRGYFSHYTPEGKSPFDRMDEANITYSAAGENLALAPNTQLAMQGLMDSPGHRANILSKDYGRVGIGAIDAGVYGVFYCQEFTN